MGFRKHVQAAANKASGAASAIARIVPNVRGASQRRRKLLTNLVNSRLLYAAPVWASTFMFQTNIKKKLRLQKTVALRVVMGFRTVSTQTALVVAGLIPAHIMVLERTRRYKDGISDKDAREVSYRKWQQECHNAEKGR